MESATPISHSERRYLYENSGGLPRAFYSRSSANVCSLLQGHVISETINNSFSYHTPKALTSSEIAVVLYSAGPSQNRVPLSQWSQIAAIPTKHAFYLLSNPVPECSSQHVCAGIMLHTHGQLLWWTSRTMTLRDGDVSDLLMGQTQLLSSSEE